MMKSIQVIVEALRWLVSIFPFFPIKYVNKKLRQNAKPQSQKSLDNNRKFVGRSMIWVTIAIFTVFIFRYASIITTGELFGKDLRAMAKQNYSMTETVYAKRGNIYDRNGIPIAIDSSNYSVHVVLDESYVDEDKNRLYAEKSDFDAIANIFQEYLGLEKDYTLSQLNKDAYQVEFGTKGNDISFETRDKIEKAAEAQGIKGIGFKTHLSRSYPNGVFASHFIGTASQKDANDETKGMVGINGIEASMNEILSGKDGKATLEKNHLGQPLPGTAESIVEAVDGEDVYTTLDSTLQTTLERLLDEMVAKTGEAQIMATMMKADTGEILATSQRPTFNPETGDVPEDENFIWQNMLYQTNYEPGSTMKVFLLGAAIQAGTFQPNASFQSGTYKIADTEIHDWDWETLNHTGLTMTFSQGFAHSSNIGMVLVEEQLGVNNWLATLDRMKFGMPTRVGFGGEASGVLPSDNIVSKTQSGFGQGISVTGIQMMRGFTTIANGGEMLEPKFISKIVNTNTNEQRVSQREVVAKIFSEATANSVLNHMESVSTDATYGTGYSALQGGPIFKLNDQPMPVKTGTAEVAKQEGGYYQGKFLNSVVAMDNPTDPNFIMYITVRLPEHYATSYSGDVINPMMRKATELKETFENTQSDMATESITLKDYIGKVPGDSMDSMRREVLQPILIGNGSKVIKQSVKAGTKVKPNSHVLILTNGDLTMPDMYDWNRTEVDQLAEWLELSVTYEGEGDKVVGQSIQANANLKNGASLKVTMGS
jgi:penicillin-binding protein 2X